MKLYVAYEHHWDGSSTIYGVFSTPEKAQEQCDILEKNKDCDWADFEAFELDHKQI